MTDVFISYANADRERARTLAGALAARGPTVWWDRKIRPGQTFDEVIERELETAKHIVVLWSNDSISSEWVKNEAAVAAQRGVLVPVLIDRVKVPLEFRRRQTVDLIGWDGRPDHAGFQALCEALEVPLRRVQPRLMYRLSRQALASGETAGGLWLLSLPCSLSARARTFCSVIHPTTGARIQRNARLLRFDRTRPAWRKRPGWIPRHESARMEQKRCPPVCSRAKKEF